jgi:hypothetical protein
MHEEREMIFEKEKWELVCSTGCTALRIHSLIEF